MPQMGKKYKIYSPDEGKIVEKSLEKFSKKERQFNIGNHGVREIGHESTDIHIPKPFDTAVASSFRVENNELILTVNSIRKEIKIRISAALINALKKSKVA
jgi:hypothetical protein